MPLRRSQRCGTRQPAAPSIAVEYEHLVSGSVQSGTNIPGLVTSTDRHDVLVFDGS